MCQSYNNNCYLLLYYDVCNKNVIIENQILFHLFLGLLGMASPPKHKLWSDISMSAAMDSILKENKGLREAA